MKKKYKELLTVCVSCRQFQGWTDQSVVVEKLGPDGVELMWSCDPSAAVCRQTSFSPVHQLSMFGFILKGNSRVFSSLLSADPTGSDFFCSWDTEPAEPVCSFSDLFWSSMIQLKLVWLVQTGSDWFDWWTLLFHEKYLKFKWNQSIFVFLLAERNLSNESVIYFSSFILIVTQTVE